MLSITDMQAGGIGGLGAALMAGFIFSFTPVSLATIPAIAAYVTKARAFREALILGSAFILGMLLTHMLLGMFAAVGGQWLERWLGPFWNAATGPFLVLLGLVWTGLIKIPLPWVTLQGRRVATLGGAFALGIALTVGICPACSPGLWVGLGASAVIGSVAYGALLMLMFAIGRAIPILLGVISMGSLESLQPISRFKRPFETLGGIVMILLGLYLLNDYYQWM
jgi:cytochrome c-type biogenesis protein